MMNEEKRKALIIEGRRAGGRVPMWMFEDEWEAMKETGRRLKAKVTRTGNRFTPKKKKRK